MKNDRYKKGLKKNMKDFNRGEVQMQESLDTQDKAKDFYSRQMLDYLEISMQEFIIRQELVFISTSDAKGECDCSIRSGNKGFVLVLDDKTIAYAEYKGNGVMASMGNIQENPHIGLLFLDFLEDKVGLHVNGKAEVLFLEELKNKFDDKLIEKLSLHANGLGQKQISWVLIKIEEAYIHCSKNIPLFKKSEDASEPTRPVDYFKLAY